MQTRRFEPTLAEQARTSLALATAATVSTRGRHSTGRSAVAAIDADDLGRPVIQLERSCDLAVELAACPVATVVVPGPAPYAALELTGGVHSAESNRENLAAFRLDPLSARLRGAQPVPIPVRELFEAEPDPLREQAAAALGHLDASHSADLLACVRRHLSCPVSSVLPRRLDRYGLELAVLTDNGVGEVRLPFAEGPVDSMDDVMTGIRLMLTCRCGEEGGGEG